MLEWLLPEKHLVKSPSQGRAMGRRGAVRISPARRSAQEGRRPRWRRGRPVSSWAAVTASWLRGPAYI